MRWYTCRVGDAEQRCSAADEALMKLCTAVRCLLVLPVAVGDEVFVVLVMAVGVVARLLAARLLVCMELTRWLHIYNNRYSDGYRYIAIASSMCNSAAYPRLTMEQNVSRAVNVAYHAVWYGALWMLAEAG